MGGEERRVQWCYRGELQWPVALGQRLAGDGAGPVSVRAWRERGQGVPLSLPVGPVRSSWLVWVQEKGKGHIIIHQVRFGLDLV